MAKLIYSFLASLDGYIADDSGAFDWAMPDEEVHTFIGELMKPVDTYLYGRTIYEMMVGWELDPALTEGTGPTADFAEIWQAAEKVVFSRTLEDAPTKRTRIERDFDPELVRRLKAESAGDLAVSGADLAASAWRAGLVDECHLFLAPIIVGGGKRLFPDGVRQELELLDERRFGNGMTFLRYAVGR